MPNVSIADGLYLVHKTLGSAASPVAVITEIPTDHIVIIDCSGSMAYELPQIRQQLKNKLAMMIKESDTVSIIWFSGRSQFGVVVEGVPLRTAVDLTGVHRAIDNYLKPVMLTGFVDPLGECAKMIDRLRKPGRAVNLFFMSDGHDNQWSKDQILKATERLQAMVSSAAVVEYGYYCNHPLMVQIAEKLGATQVLAEQFSQYEPIFESAMSRRAMGVKKVEVNVGSPLHGVVFATHEGEVISFSVDNHKVLVPEGLTDLYWFAETPPSANFNFASEVVEKKTKHSDDLQRSLYAGLVPLTQRMLSNDIFKVLKVLGDVRLIRQFGNCFGKQAYVEFQNSVTQAAFDPTRRHTDGYNPNEVPPDDAYTILDLLHQLSSDEGNFFFPSHESFSYERTGRKAVQADRVLNEDEQQRVAEIAKVLGSTSNPATIVRLQKELSDLVEDRKGINFVADHEHAGYPVSSLVFNEDRPNISAHVEIPGTVDLTEVAGDFAAAQGSPFTMDIRTLPFPVKFPTKIHRNYTIIRDGIRNVKVLPVSLTEKTFDILVHHDVIDVMAEPWHADQIYEIDLMKLPLINRKMVKSARAKDLFQKQFDLLRAKANQKVFNYYFGEHFTPEATKGFTDQYGADAAAWLAGLGIKDYGFSPKVELAEATESYYGKELKVSVAGLSSLPGVKDVLAKLDGKKKLTTREAMLAPGIAEVKGFLTSAAYTSVNKDAQESLLRVWLTSRKRDTTTQVRKAMRELSEIKFSVIVGQVWFEEFDSLDDNSLTMTLDGTAVVCTANLNEVEIKV